MRTHFALILVLSPIAISAQSTAPATNGLTTNGDGSELSGCLSGSPITGTYTLTDKSRTIYKLTGNLDSLRVLVGTEVHVVGQDRSAPNSASNAAASGGPANPGSGMDSGALGSGSAKQFNVTSATKVADQCGSAVISPPGPTGSHELPHLHEIIGKFDKFKNVTTFRSENTDTGHVSYDGGKRALVGMKMSAGFDCRGQLDVVCPISNSSGYLVFIATTMGWHFSDNRELILLIDGEPLNLGSMSWDGQVLGADDLREYLGVDINPSILIKLAHAKTVEAQLGIFEFSFTQENLAVFKELDVHLSNR